MDSHGFQLLAMDCNAPTWNFMVSDLTRLVRTFTSLLFGLGLLNCKIAHTYLKVFELDIFGPVVFE